MLCSFRPKLRKCPVGVEIVCWQVAWSAVGPRRRQVSFIVFICRASAVDFPCTSLPLHSNSRDARKLHNLHETDVQQTIGYSHILKRVIQRPVSADLCKDVQLINYCFALKFNSKDPFARFIIVRLRELQCYLIFAVRHFQSIGAHVPADRLIKGVILGIRHRVVREGSDVAALAALGELRLRRFDLFTKVRIPAALFPACTRQCRDVGPKDACSPVDAHQTRTAVGQRVGCIAPHSACPELWDNHSRVILQPRYGPFWPALKTRKAGLDRLKSYLAIDTAKRHLFRQSIVKLRPVLWRP